MTYKNPTNFTGIEGQEEYNKAMEHYSKHPEKYEVREPIHISTENIAELFKGRLTEKEFRQVCNPFDNDK